MTADECLLMMDGNSWQTSHRHEPSSTRCCRHWVRALCSEENALAVEVPRRELLPRSVRECLGHPRGITPGAAQ
jgi:hypothetical protein